MDATVIQTVYAGATTTFLLRAREGVAVRSVHQSRDVPTVTPGAAVQLAWSPSHTIILTG